MGHDTPAEPRPGYYFLVIKDLAAALQFLIFAATTWNIVGTSDLAWRHLGAPLVGRLAHDHLSRRRGRRRATGRPLGKGAEIEACLRHYCAITVADFIALGA